MPDSTTPSDLSATMKESLARLKRDPALQQVLAALVPPELPRYQRRGQASADSQKHDWVYQSGFVAGWEKLRGLLTD